MYSLNFSKKKYDILILDDGQVDFKLQTYNFYIINFKSINFFVFIISLLKFLKSNKDKLSFKEIYKQIDKSLHFRGQDFDNMYMTSFIQYLIDYGWQVKASLIKNGWLEVDTVEDLESYDQMSKETLDSYCRL